MSNSGLLPHISIVSSMTIMGFLFAGMLVGGLHFLTLRSIADMLTKGRSAFLVLALQLLRICCLAGFLILTAIYSDILSLFATLAGILVARSVILRMDCVPL